MFLGVESPQKSPHFTKGTVADCTQATGMQTVIPPRKNRKEQRKYDEVLYKLTAVQIHCLAVWAENLVTTQSNYFTSMGVIQTGYASLSVLPSV